MRDEDKSKEELIKELVGLRKLIAQAQISGNEHKNLMAASKESEEELGEKIRDLERFRKVAVGREMKMIELKEKIKELEFKLKQGKSTN